jgi:hypothetical protein
MLQMHFNWDVFLEAGDLIFLPHLASRAGCWSGRLAAADNLQQDEDGRTV